MLIKMCTVDLFKSILIIDLTMTVIFYENMKSWCYRFRSIFRYE